MLKWSICEGECKPRFTPGGVAEADGGAQLEYRAGWAEERGRRVDGRPGWLVARLPVSSGGRRHLHGRARVYAGRRVAKVPVAVGPGAADLLVVTYKPVVLDDQSHPIVNLPAIGA